MVVFPSHDGGAIYGLGDPNTGELRYVGMTRRSVKLRYQCHMLKARKGEQTYVHRWIRNLAAPPAIVILEDGIPDSEICEREKYWVALARRKGARLTNATDGGETTWLKPGTKLPPEWRAKISAAAKGRDMSALIAKSADVRRGKPIKDHVKRALSQAHRGNQWAKGHQHTDEAKQKIGDANRARNQSARMHTPEIHAKIAATLSGRKLSKEHKDAIRKASEKEETREKLRAAGRLGAAARWGK